MIKVVYSCNQDDIYLVHHCSEGNPMFLEVAEDILVRIYGNYKDIDLELVDMEVEL